MTTDKHHHNDIGCLEAMEWLYAWLDGEIGEETAAEQVQYHVNHCKSCFSRAEMEKALNERLRGTTREYATEKLKKRMKKLIDSL
jgi:anti-sigma factor (TIGR02949 family)